MMRLLDWPPIWLGACLVAAWLDPFRVDTGALRWVGYILIALAVGLVIASLFEFRRARTTFIPREAPSALITSGVFRLTRNPIYLADLLLLAGVSLILGSLIGLCLTPLLAVILERRFILGEEEKLRAAFPDACAHYVDRTRRWL